MTKFKQWATQIINALPPSKNKETCSQDEPKTNLNPQKNPTKRLDVNQLWAKEPREIPIIEVHPEDFDANLRLGNEEGFEAFAFYKSIHFVHQQPYPGLWGIFLLDSGVGSIAQLIRSINPLLSHQQAQYSAMRILHRHERFHFHVDVWTILQESLQQRRIYEPYMKNMYQKLHPSTLCVEEGLANRHLVDSTIQFIDKDFIYSIISTQPPAYQFPKQGDIPLYRAELASQILDQKTRSSRRLGIESGVAHGRESKFGHQNCPTYLVQNYTPSKIIAPYIGIPNRREIRRFIINYLSGKHICTTDHQYYKIDNGKKIRLPNKHSNIDRLKPDEFYNILSKAGLSKREYWIKRIQTKLWKSNCPRYLQKV